MASTFFTFILGAASIYFFYQYSFFIAVILLVWTLSRLFGVSLQRLAKGVEDLASYSDLEKKCNVFIQLRLDLGAIVEHPAFDDLFTKLKEHKAIKDENKKGWTDRILENYKKKNGKKEAVEELKFNIKNNLVWKNGTVDFDDTVYHEIVLPYEYKAGKDDEWLSPWKENQSRITVRVFIVNGIIKLQIGRFSKDYTPKVLRGGFLAVYKTWADITTFPLMYFSFWHKIPEKYLNLTAYATESWKNLHGESGAKKPGFTSDWEQLNKEVQDYNYVCSVADQSINDRGKWEKIVKNFGEKRNEWLKREGFNDPFAKDEGEGWVPDFMSDDTVSSFNKYLSVYVANLNDFQEKRQKYTYTDYWEETP